MDCSNLRLPLQDITSPPLPEPAASPAPSDKWDGASLSASAANTEAVEEAIESLDLEEAKALLHQHAAACPSLRDAIIHQAIRRSIPLGQGEIKTFDLEFNLADEKFYWARLCDGPYVSPLVKARQAYSAAQNSAMKIKNILETEDNRPETKMNAVLTLADICVGLARLVGIIPRLKDLIEHSTRKDDHLSLDSIVAFAFNLLSENHRAVIVARKLRDSNTLRMHLAETNWEHVGLKNMIHMPIVLNVETQNDHLGYLVLPIAPHLPDYIAELETEVLSFHYPLQRAYEVLSTASNHSETPQVQVTKAYAAAWELPSIIKDIHNPIHWKSSFGTKLNAFVAIAKICTLIVESDGIPTHMHKELIRQLNQENGEIIESLLFDINIMLAPDEITRLATEPIKLPSNQQLHPESWTYSVAPVGETREEREEPTQLYHEHLRHIIALAKPNYPIFNGLLVHFQQILEKEAERENKKAKDNEEQEREEQEDIYNA